MVRLNIPVRLREKQNGGGYSRPLDCLVFIIIIVITCFIILLFFYTIFTSDVMCGLLHCVHQNEKLMFWKDNLAHATPATFLTIGHTTYVCRGAILDVGLDMPDPGMTPNGAKCGNRQVRLCQKLCLLDTTTSQYTTECSSKLWDGLLLEKDSRKS